MQYGTCNTPHSKKKFSRNKWTALTFAEPNCFHILMKTIILLFQSLDWRSCGVTIHECVRHSDSFSSGSTVKLTAQSSLDTNNNQQVQKLIQLCCEIKMTFSWTATRISLLHTFLHQFVYLAASFLLCKCDCKSFEMAMNKYLPRGCIVIAVWTMQQAGFDC